MVTSRAFLTSSSGGLETALFAFLVTVALLLAVDSFERSGFVAWMCGPILALACLTRPEGALFAGFVGLLSLYGYAINRDRFAHHFRWVALFSLLFLPYVAWKTLYFGSPLPNTFYAKTGGGLRVVQGWAFFAQFVHSHGLYSPMVLAPLALLGTRDRRVAGRSMLLAATVGYLSYVIGVGGDFFEFRFFAPILPVLYFLAQEGLREVWIRLRLRAPALAAVVVALVLAASLVPAVRPLRHYEHPQRFGWTYAALSGDAWIKRFVEVPFLSRFTRTDESISLTGIGIVPFYTDLYCFDMLGLIAADVADWKPGSPFGDLPGHSRYAYDAYADQHIDYHVFNDLVPLNRIWSAAPVVHPEVISVRNPANNHYFSFKTSNDTIAFRRELRRRGAQVLFPLTDQSILFDFESQGYDGWTFTGTAFGSAPARGAFPGQSPVSGYQGELLINTFLDGSDGSIGTAVSPDFKIDREIVFLWIGGGLQPRALRAELWVDDERIGYVTGHDSEEMRPVQFDVSEHVGRIGKLVLKDLARGSWGHLLVDRVGLARPADR